VTVTVGELLWREIEVGQGANGNDAGAVAPAGNRSPLMSDDDLAEDDLGGCVAQVSPMAVTTALIRPSWRAAVRDPPRNEPVGTPVLALYKLSNRYYPAVIEGYDSKKARLRFRPRSSTLPRRSAYAALCVWGGVARAQKLYRVRFEDDDRVARLRRSQLFTVVEPGFRTCQVRRRSGPRRGIHTRADCHPFG